MNIKKNIVFLLILSSICVFGQKPGSILFTIGDQTITTSEFTYIYEKNNKGDENYYKEESVSEYLDLFIKFKLKVKEARSQGIDTSKKFLDEFKTYRDQLVKPYLTDTESINKLMREAYERMKYEINASHILIRVNEDAAPEDTLKAYNKTKEAYEKAIKGESFEKLASEYSDDPTVKRNKGNLGYFSVFHLIYAFETVAFNTAKEEISQIFRTQFGYHFIKVFDKRPYRGQIKAAQIAIKVNKNQDMAKARIDSVYNKLLAGSSFVKLVEEYSEDLRTNKRKGELPEFNSFTKISQELKDQAFGLKNDGDFSKPFKVNNEWFIIKRINLTGLKSYEELENYIKNKVNRDIRSKISEETTISRIKKETKFKEKKSSLDIFHSELDSNLLKGKWKISDSNKFTDFLFQIGKEKFLQIDLAKFIESRQRQFRYSTIEFSLNKFYTEFVNNTLLDYYDRHLEENEPDFKNLVNEYREGMLLFDITDKLVWSKAMNDTTGQEQFYENNKGNYMWNERIDAIIYICHNKEIANKVLTFKKEEKKPEEMAKILNEDNPLNLSYSKGLFEKGENETLDNYFDKTGIFIVENSEDNKIKVLDIKEVLPSEPKKLNEIKGLVIADYQNHLEKEWIIELKAKYPVKINEKIYTKIIEH